MKNNSLNYSMKSKVLLVLAIFLFLNVWPAIETSFGQAPTATNIQGVQSQVQSSANGIIQMVKYVIGAVLFVALVTVVYMVATNHPKSKEYIIGWIVALVVYIIAVAIM